VCGGVGCGVNCLAYRTLRAVCCCVFFIVLYVASAPLVFSPIHGIMSACPTPVSDYQISLGLEAARCGEMLFQPSMLGIDQQGLGELVPTILKRCPPHLQQQLASRIFLCGGLAQMQGLDRRLYAAVRQERPWEEPVKLWSVDQVSTAPWRGAARWVRQTSLASFQSASCSRAFYEESGGDRVVVHWASNENVL
jgi:actin-related protein